MDEAERNGPGSVHNTGVYVAGGISGGNNIMSGAGSRVTATQNQQAADPLAQIDQLLAELREAAARQLDPEQARQAAAAVESVRQEAHDSTPDAGRIRQALGRLTAAVLPAAGLLANVEEIRQLIASVLGL